MLGVRHMWWQFPRWLLGFDCKAVWSQKENDSFNKKKKKNEPAYNQSVTVSMFVWSCLFIFWYFWYQFWRSLLRFDSKTGWNRKENDSFNQKKKKNEPAYSQSLTVSMFVWSTLFCFFHIFVVNFYARCVVFISFLFIVSVSIFTLTVRVWQ